MRRIYEPGAYETPRRCYWDEGVTPPVWPRLEGADRAVIAIIGGGYTGVSAALTLAEAGAEVILVDAETPGWGASGRNGGFCCLGGAKAPASLLRRRFGEDGLAEWRSTEMAAIETVAARLSRYGIEADTHSDGETLLAHTPRQARGFEAAAREIEAAYGLAPRIHARETLRQGGFGGTFHGAMTTPLGFALHPRKYHGGLARAAQKAGARLYGQSPAIGLKRGRDWRIDTPHGQIRADSVLIATNGYSSEDLPDWLRARTLPVQSSVIVTRPLTDAEREAQGWTTRQMAYDTRQLLHYFRLLPDNRFLFGMRGGLTARPSAATAISARIRRDFARMFPAWRDVAITHEWSGLVCLMANLAPYAGPVPGHPGLFAALGYHGNGVAMASHTGGLIAEDILGRGPAIPAVMRHQPGRFPLGRYRRALLAPAYLAAEWFDL
ncbi:FAD-binding oxidoreductase [Roseivivax sp. THAF30]|uniref:NAD(P)/FAD-dependent oxidoreductase n=1 Tax=Roseivivax sp. THAF30 TaxID=2587852 RepID=UPI001268C279|nr:FAD-dependent oxidoreductase [Roseivivax sp. THAF30]QFT61629.1 Gamma-glutamylputrescine oxidoreductase [Roseivivax sp. THAF30]